MNELMDVCDGGGANDAARWQRRRELIDIEAAATAAADRVVAVDV